MADHSEEKLRRAAEARTRIREISPDEAAKITGEGGLLLDVRTSEDFADDHLENAVLLPSTELEKISELAPDKSTPIVCYCNGGTRGILSADKLREMGYTNAMSIKGGLRAAREN